MRWFLTVTLLASPAAARAADPTPATVDALVNDALKAFRAPGAAVVVVRGDQTLILRGYGKRASDANDPVTADTLFPLASCTKQFTTALLAVLADDGVLGWDDRVSKHLPAFKLSDPNASALLTVRDLVTHRTGLAAHDLLWYRAPWDIDHALKQVPLLPLDYEFRSGFRYNSLTFMAAGRVAERCVKKPWADQVRERLTDPLGMTGVAFTTSDIPKNADRATGHRPTKGGAVAREPVYEMKEPNAAGSLFATPRDLAAWLQFQVSEGIAPSGRRLVSVKNLLETRAPQNPMRLDGAAGRLLPDTVQASYAMGWVVNDHRGLKVVGHGGLIDGFRVQLTLVPDKELGFAVLTNLHDSRLPLAVTHALIDRYCALTPKDWNGHYLKMVADDDDARRAALAARDAARAANTTPAAPVAALAGEYRHPAYGAATVTHAHGELTARFSGFVYPLEHYERDTFRITDGPFADELAAFAVADGKAKSLTLSGITFERK